TLDNANLSGANLRTADLREANLRFASLSDANLEGADLFGANLIGADLHGADLTGANLTDASLERADLRGAKLQSATMFGVKYDFLTRGLPEKCDVGPKACRMAGRNLVAQFRRIIRADVPQWHYRRVPLTVIAPGTRGHPVDAFVAPGKLANIV